MRRGEISTGASAGTTPGVARGLGGTNRRGATACRSRSDRPPTSCPVAPGEASPGLEQPLFADGDRGRRRLDRSGSGGVDSRPWAVNLRENQPRPRGRDPRRLCARMRRHVTAPGAITNPFVPRWTGACPVPQAWTRSPSSSPGLCGGCFVEPTGRLSPGQPEIRVAKNRVWRCFVLAASIGARSRSLGG